MAYQAFFPIKLLSKSIYIFAIFFTFHTVSPVRAEEIDHTNFNKFYTESSYQANTDSRTIQEHFEAFQRPHSNGNSSQRIYITNTNESNSVGNWVITENSDQSKRLAKSEKIVSQALTSHSILQGITFDNSYENLHRQHELSNLSESPYDSDNFPESSLEEEDADEDLDQGNRSQFSCDSENGEDENDFSSFLALSYKIRGVTGSETNFFKAAISEIVTPYLGKSIDCNDFSNIRDEITRFYIQEGYITSRADLPIGYGDGTLIIPILEGYISEVKVETIRGAETLEASRLLTQYVNTQISSAIPQPRNGPVDFTEVENQVRLLALDPLFVQDSVYSVLSNGESDQYSNLTIYLEEEERLNIGLSFNNYSPPSLGAEGFDWQVGFNGRIFSYGERIYAGGRYNPFVNRSSSRTITTTSGDDSSEFGGSDDSTAWVLGYSLPLGSSARGGLGTLELQVGRERKDVLQGLASEFDFRSEVERFSIDYRYPISRNLGEEWAVVGGFTFEEGQTFINKTFPFGIGFGPDDRGISRTSTFSLALEYLRRGSSNVLLSRGQINFGTGLFDATQNESPLPDGQFFSLFLQTQLSQKLAENHLLVIRGLAQLTPDSLLPVNQFVIGGSQSVRGYRENIRSGDNGFVFSVEDRIGLFPHYDGQPQLQVIPFFDLGAVWNNGSNPNIIPNDNFLASLGISLTYQPFRGRLFEPLAFRLDYGIPLIDVEGNGDNLQDNGIHFGINYSISFF